MKLIINADDFGITKGVNYGIIDAYKDGVVTSTTMMANQIGFEHGVMLAKENPGLGIGVHLALTAGGPVSKGLKTLVAENGRFFKQGPVFGNEITFDPIELEEEFTAQIEKILNAGIKITHLDSHHHVHGLPQVTPVFCKIAKKYGFPIRYLPQIKEAIKEHGLKSTEQFSDRFYDANVSVEDLIDICSAEAESLEVMCHPAYVDHQLYSKSGYSIKRTLELHVLSCNEIKEFIKKKNITLCTYTAL